MWTPREARWSRVYQLRVSLCADECKIVYTLPTEHPTNVGPSKLSSKATLPMQNRSIHSLTHLMSIITGTSSWRQTGWGLHFSTYVYRLVYVYNEPTHDERNHYVVIMIQPRVYVLLPSTCWMCIMCLMCTLRWMCAAVYLIITKLSFQDIYICWTGLKQTDTNLPDDTQYAKSDEKFERARNWHWSSKSLHIL